MSAAAVAPALLEVDDLHTQFQVKNKLVRAVNGVSFSLRRGEILGIAGESGSGKSVTCLSILRLVPKPGRIVKGRIHFFQKPGGNEYITALILYPTKEEPLDQIVKIIPPPPSPYLN